MMLRNPLNRTEPFVKPGDERRWLVRLAVESALCGVFLFVAVVYFFVGIYVENHGIDAFQWPLLHLRHLFVFDEALASLIFGAAFVAGIAFWVVVIILVRIGGMIDRISDIKHETR